jgi:prepilin-type N-terminal cleavage/methylation domain-containing protein
MLKGARGRRGFTLIETVVTVGIVATLAAVVVPQVVKQFDAADPARIQNDLKNLQTAIETFNVNVKVMPGDLDDLANPVTEDTDFSNGAADTVITGAGGVTAFTTGSNAAWNGPYIDFSLVETGTTEQTRPTGYSATIHDNFVCYNATDSPTNTVGSPGPTLSQACPSPDATDRLFLAIRITGLGTASDDKFKAVNDLFDGSSESDRATQGRVRLLGTTTYFLVLPLN